MIILDEPTNHLDIDSRAALAEAINEFPGAVIMVSHDRYLIEACADQLWVVANRTVTPYDGDLDDYRRDGAVDRAACATRTRDRDERARKDSAKPAARQERKAHAAAAEDRRGGGRDRAHQRHHRQDRRGARAAGHFTRDPEQAAQLSKARSAARAKRAAARGRGLAGQASASLESARSG